MTQNTQSPSYSSPSATAEPVTAEDVSTAEATKINVEIAPIEGVVEFADAEKGDFTQKQTSAGDPRWIANAQ